MRRPLDPARDFERLREPACRRFVRRARRAGQHRLHDLDDLAEEAYQDAWLELMRGPERTPADPAAYLAGIMWHGFYRRHLRGRAPELEELPELADPAAGPEQEAVGAAAARGVREALRELPDREREALLLRALGLGSRDVALSLGVSALRARKLTDSARRTLSKRLSAGDAGERCVRTASLLRAVAAGWPVTSERRARVAHHVDGCAFCRATVAEMRREGRLALLPVALAAPGPVDRAGEVADALLHGALRLVGRGGGGGEAAAGGGAAAGGAGAAAGGGAATGGAAAAGGAASTAGGALGAGALSGVGAKLAAGCAALCVVGAGTAVVATDRDDADAAARSDSSGRGRTTVVGAGRDSTLGLDLREARVASRRSELAAERRRARVTARARRDAQDAATRVRQASGEVQAGAERVRAAAEDVRQAAARVESAAGRAKGAAGEARDAAGQAQDRGAEAQQQAQQAQGYAEQATERLGEVRSRLEGLGLP